MSNLNNDQILYRSLKAGAQEAEIYATKNKQVTIKVSNSNVETLNVSSGGGIGLRVLVNQRPGYAYTSDLREDSVMELIHSAIDNALYSSSDEKWTLPTQDNGTSLKNLCPEEFSAWTTEDKVNLSLKLEEITCKQNRFVKRCREVIYADNHIHVQIKNTNGLSRSDNRSVSYALATAVADNGEDIQPSNFFTAGRSPTDLDIELCASEAARRASNQLNPKKLKSKKLPVIFESYSAAIILGNMSSMLCANQVQNNRSIFTGKIGHMVAGNNITIVDDGRLSEGLATRSWDGEGIATGKQVLIDNGKLMGILHNNYTANKAGVKSTGNADRASYRSFPTVKPSNFYLLPGITPQEEIISEANEAIFITGIHGIRAGNSVTGEFSIGISGHYIKNGELIYPITDVTIAGRFTDLLNNIEKVGDDLRFLLFGGGMCGSPTILVSDLQVSGT
ncbi:TldD/PmbA family protein [Evansella clarkii]|uniref:TldD/PmbA family protein n=1 Tax=Evansella clarkii TaxID=79879 RepID=UPI0009973361|nr:TldD/PmbA family protein [Evansella clarkii]